MPVLESNIQQQKLQGTDYQEDFKISNLKMNLIDNEIFSITKEEIDILNILNNLRENCLIQSKQIDNKFEDSKLNISEDISKDNFFNKIYYIELIKNIISILKFKKSTFVNANLLFDKFLLTLNFNYNSISKKDLELYALTCVILSSKTEENDPDVPSLYTFGTLLSTKYFSVENLKKSEVIILKTLDYNVNIVSCYSIISYLIGGGIIFNDDFIFDDDQKKYEEQQYLDFKQGNLFHKINNLCKETAVKLISHPFIIKYDQYFLSSGIILYVRKFFGLQIWNEKLKNYGFMRDNSLESLLIVEEIIKFIDKNKSFHKENRNQTDGKENLFISKDNDKNNLYNTNNKYYQFNNSKNNFDIKSKNDMNSFQINNINKEIKNRTYLIDNYNQNKIESIKSFQNFDLLYKTKKIFQRTNQLEKKSIFNDYSSINIKKKYSNMDLIQKSKNDYFSILNNNKTENLYTNREYNNQNLKLIPANKFYFDYNKLKDEKGLYSSFNINN